MLEPYVYDVVSFVKSSVFWSLTLTAQMCGWFSEDLVLESSEHHWSQGLLQVPQSVWMAFLWAGIIQGAYSHSFEVET